MGSSLEIAPGDARRKTDYSEDSAGRARQIVRGGDSFGLRFGLTRALLGPLLLLPFEKRDGLADGFFSPPQAATAAVPFIQGEVALDKASGVLPRTAPDVHSRVSARGRPCGN